MIILIWILLELWKNNQGNLEVRESKRQIATVAVPGNISWRRYYNSDLREHRELTRKNGQKVYKTEATGQDTEMNKLDLDQEPNMKI